MTATARASTARRRLPNPLNAVLHWLLLRGLRAPRQGGVRAVVSLSAFAHIAPEHQLDRIDCPVLPVHGEQDQTVPLADAHRLQALLRCGELLAVEGDHDLRMSLAPHADQLVGFFSTHLEVIAHPCSND